MKILFNLISIIFIVLGVAGTGMVTQDTITTFLLLKKEIKKELTAFSIYYYSYSLYFY
jgi:hypothetical protein